MPQIHLRAEPEDYASIVLLPGDPNRATRIAGRLDGARRVTEHRALYGYTGSWRGTPVSVQATGMGAPSISIVVEELLRLGVKRFVRVGTCGGIGPGIRTGDLVVATGATPVDGATREYLHGEPYAPVADFELTRTLVDTALAAGIHAHVGPVASVDVFYNTDEDYATKWRSRGILAFEMEASALFFLASRARGSGADVRAACILTVSDVLGPQTSIEETYLPLSELEAATDRMIEVALDAAAKA
jgi:purine-nucleoside phosphorylase